MFHGVIFGTLLVDSIGTARVITSASLIVLMLVMAQAMWFGSAVQMLLVVRRIAAMQATRASAAHVFA